MQQSKTDFETLSQIILDIVKNLNDEQYEKLLHKQAHLKYTEPPVSNETIYQQVFIELNNQSSDEAKRKLLANKKNNLSTKKQLLEFCKLHNLNAQATATKEEIIQHIIMPTQSPNSDTVNILAQALQQTTNIEDAWKLYHESPFKKTKANLKKLATILDVTINSKLKVTEIPDKIIKTIVQSKIDSQIIRKGN